VPKKDNTGFLLSPHNYDKSHIRKRTSFREKFISQRKKVVVVVVGWQGSKQ